METQRRGRSWRAPASAREGLAPFQTPRFTRTLSQWLNMLLDAGFVLERVGEPCPSDEAAHAYPNVQDAQVVAYFLHLRARKPACGTHLEDSASSR